MCRHALTWAVVLLMGLAGSAQAATRLYFRNEPADFVPTPIGTWNAASPTPNMTPRKMAVTKGGTPGTQTSYETIADNADTLVQTFVSEGLQSAGDIAAGSVSFTIGTAEGISSEDALTHIRIWVSIADTSSKRCDLLLDTINGVLSTASEWGNSSSTLTGVFGPQPTLTPMTTLACTGANQPQPGDHIVLELGANDTSNSNPTNHWVAISYGGTDADLAAGGTTMSHPGWIEFSQTIVFGATATATRTPTASNTATATSTPTNTPVPTATSVPGMMCDVATLLVSADADDATVRDTSGVRTLIGGSTVAVGSFIGSNYTGLILFHTEDGTLPADAIVESADLDVPILSTFIGGTGTVTADWTDGHTWTTADYAAPGSLAGNAVLDGSVSSLRATSPNYWTWPLLHAAANISTAEPTGIRVNLSSTSGEIQWSSHEGGGSVARMRIVYCYPTPSETPTITPTPSPTATATPVGTCCQCVNRTIGTPTDTGTVTTTPTVTLTPTVTATATPSPTPAPGCEDVPMTPIEDTYLSRIDVAWPPGGTTQLEPSFLTSTFAQSSLAGGAYTVDVTVERYDLSPLAAIVPQVWSLIFFHNIPDNHDNQDLAFGWYDGALPISIADYEWPPRTDAADVSVTSLSTSLSSPRSYAVSLTAPISYGSTLGLKIWITAVSAPTGTNDVIIQSADSMSGPVLSVYGCPPTPTDTPTVTATFTDTATDTPSGTPTMTDTPTPTDTETGTVTDTATPTLTGTRTATATVTRTGLATNTPASTTTPRPTHTAGPTPTPWWNRTPEPHGWR